MLEELKRYVKHASDAESDLRAYANAVKSGRDLHFLPYLTADAGPDSTQVAIQMINFSGREPVERKITGPAAALIYEAYQAALPDILARAVELAHTIKARKIEEARGALDAFEEES